MKDEIRSGILWNNNYLYAPTIGVAISNANRHSCTMAAPKTPEEYEEAVRGYHRELRFTLREMLLSDRFDDDLTTIKKLLTEINQTFTRPRQQQLTYLDAINDQVSEIILRSKIIELNPGRMEVAETALTMMR